MNRSIDDITLYPIEPDPILAEKVRRKVGQNLRLGIGIVGFLFILAVYFDLIAVKPHLKAVVTVGTPLCWLLLLLELLRRLSKAPVSRVLKVGVRSIRDCVSIRAPQDHIERYRYSGMRGCTITTDGLTIVMSDGRRLDMPAKAFANQYEMKAFAKALAEQKNVAVIGLTSKEASSVS